MLKLPGTASRVRPLFLSSYPPRQCGIATFTRDLQTAVGTRSGQQSRIIAVEPDDQPVEYDPAVMTRIRKQNHDDYLRAAATINQSNITAVSLQHEFGLFGGDSGDYILSLAAALEKPLFTTFHTILSQPSASEARVVQTLARYSARVVVMTATGRTRLVEHYGVPAAKIALIPHGVTIGQFDPSTERQRRGWQTDQVLLMTGLLGPDKGIEYVIHAMPAILKQCPRAHFVIAGATHPEIRRQRGEAYRQELQALAARLGVAERVTFDNRYLSLDELLATYAAADLYLTPHTQPEQITSGTLAYAFGMGKACISTPYVYARDLLRGGRGALVAFRDSQSIADTAIALLTDPTRRRKMEQQASLIGRQMAWPVVAERYHQLFYHAATVPVRKETYAQSILAASD